MKKFPAWLVPCGALVVSATWLAAPAQAASARAELKDAKGARVGEVALLDTPDGVKVTATFTDLPPGEHAFHVHAVGKCEPPFTSADGHFNPTGKRHGRDNPQGPHLGDMPNITVSQERRGAFEIVLRGASLDGSANGLLDADGASLVVHEGPDDYQSDPAGNAGPPIACGVITAR